MEVLYSRFCIPWRAAHRHLITEHDFENVNIPIVCDELRQYLGSARYRPVGRLTLGAAAVLVNGTATLLQHKAEQTLEDTFQLTLKIMLRNYKTLSECDDSENELEVEDVESEVDENSEVDGNSGTSVTLPSKRPATATNDLEMSKRVRFIEHTDVERYSCDDESDSGSSGNALENVTEETDEENDDPESSDAEEENISNTFQDKAVQTCRCLCEHSATGRGHRGFDPNLKLGVMLVYDNCDRAIPSKLLISSLNPRANL